MPATYQARGNVISMASKAIITPTMVFRHIGFADLRQQVALDSAKAELLSAHCFATPASKRNVPEYRAKPNCFLSLNY